MLEIGDVWVNWTEGAEYAYQVYYPFEWKENDMFERLTLVPALKITPSFFDYIENGLNELPDALFLALQHERNPYCFIVSDGERSLVIDTLGYLTPMRKSRMQFEQEQLMLRYLQYEPLCEYTYSTPEDVPALFALTPEHMTGLTREEREKKQLLLDALYGLKNEKKAKIFYYYIEFNHMHYNDIKSLKKAHLYEQFLSEVKEGGWTTCHDHLLGLFLRENEELQLLYDIRV